MRTTVQAARILGIAPNHLQRLVWDGTIAAPARLGRAFAWDNDAMKRAGWAVCHRDISDLLQGQEVKAE